VQHSDSRADSQAITVFAVLNFALAGLSALWLLFWIGILVYGIGFSGDEGKELAAGVIGTAVLGLPGLAGLFVYVLAGFGLLRRAAWGYYLHFIGAALAALTCIGLIYTVLAIVVATQPDFRQAFFPPPRWESY
jgi:hypothetical protein